MDGSIQIVCCFVVPSTVSKIRFYYQAIISVVENAYEKMAVELEMAKTTFDEEILKRDAIIDELLADNAGINSDLSLLNNQTALKCKTPLIFSWIIISNEYLVNDIEGWKAQVDVNMDIAQAERTHNRAALESYDLTCQKCSGSTNPAIDPWENFSSNGVKIPVNIGHCEFESVSKAGPIYTNPIK